MSKLRGPFDVRAGERRNTFAAFVMLLVLTSGHTLLETARDALFLSRVPATKLPWVYLIVVVLALTIARAKAMANKGAIVIALLTGAGITTSFWFLTASSHSRFLYALYIWSALFVSWVTTQFWTLLGRIHTMTQAKRLYGFIGAGAVLGGVIGAFAARAALSFIPPRAILLTSSLLFALATVPVMIMRTPAPSTAGTRAPAPDKPAPMTAGANMLWRTVFARRVLAIVLVATIVVTLADFLFKAKLAATYSNSQELAARLATFYAVTNSLALVAQVVVGPWVFRTIGVQRALFVFPVLLLGGAGAVLTSGGALLSALSLKGIDASLRYSIHKTSVELLQVPIPDGTRERVKPIIELLGTRGGQAVASVVILALAALGASSITVVGIIIVALLGLWLANVVTIRQHYLDVFRDTLRTGGISGEVELPELDLGALELLFAGLNSSRDTEVLAALELLAEQNRQRLIPALILFHPSRNVVLRALELFTKQKRTDFVAIADRLNAVPDRDVASAALRARAAVAPDQQLLERRLEDASACVAATALVALMAHGWIGDAEADERIRAILASQSVETTCALVRAIRDIPEDLAVPAATRERFDGLLISAARRATTFHFTETGAAREILRPDVLVHLEIARAMATTSNPAFLPVLVGMLSRHELRATARAAIQRNPEALAFVDEVLRHRDYARDVRVHLPRTMALLDPDVAAPTLLRALDTETDGAVRYKMLRALLKLRRANPKFALDEELLARATASTLDHAEELQRWEFGLARASDGPIRAVRSPGQICASEHLLVDLVHDKSRHARQRLFMLFELIHNENFDDIERGLRSADPKTRANSLELLENILSPAHRERVAALVGDARDSALAENVPSLEAVLVEMHEKGGRTMRALADHRAAELGLTLGEGVPFQDMQALADEPGAPPPHAVFSIPTGPRRASA